MAKQKGFKIVPPQQDWTDAQKEANIRLQREQSGEDILTQTENQLLTDHKLERAGTETVDPGE